MAEYRKSEAKDWAKERFRGLENVLMPSLRVETIEEDSTTWNLDAEGIRHDVRECKRHRFFMTTAAVEGLPFMMMEYVMREFWETAVDEAAGEILIDAYISQNTFEDTIAAAKLADEVGCDCIMLAYPPYFHPESEDDIYKFTKAVCDAIDIAVSVYPTHKYDFERFHPSSFSPRLLARIAEIENVVAMKMGVIDMSHATQCFRMFGDKALLGPPSPQFWNTYVPLCGQQWAGSVPYEGIQDKENTYLVDYFELLLEGKLEEAMDLYWRIFPGVQMLQELLDYTIYEGNYNFIHWKYLGWLAGFNGGPITLPTARLYEHQKEKIKAARTAIGLANSEPEEEFYVGRVRYGE